METYKETKNIVNIGSRTSEEFCIRNRLRQGCPMSLTLFNIYMRDLEEKIRRKRTGGVCVIMGMTKSLKTAARH